MRLSKYMQIGEKLGFIDYEKSNGHRISMEEQLEALLKIFYLAGYFNLSNIWNDLNCIGNIENIEEIFDDISFVVQYSKADQPDPDKFDAEYMRINLFHNSNIDLQDALDWILYIAQHAFGREVGQERHELVSPDWLNNNEVYYLKQARILGLIDREHPTLNEYDGCWIAGADRMTFSQRIIDYNNNIYYQGITINGETLVLTGQRELWANIDGMPREMRDILMDAYQRNIDVDTIYRLPSIVDDAAEIMEEGKEYMKNLAQLYQIKLNPSKPFVQYANIGDCPLGRFPNRIYANYDDINETSKLTETLLSRDLLEIYSNDNIHQINIIDTSAEKQHRPNTASTARDATERFVKNIFSGEYGYKRIFNILLSTNNPYIERQTLTTQWEVNKVLEENGLAAKGYQIKIEGVGFSCEQSLAIVHSELGALITEKYKHAVSDMERTLGRRPKRHINCLLFQTRDKNIIIPNQPQIENNHNEHFI